MSELSFLLDLLLNHKLSKSVKDLIANRIREIESRTTALSPARIVSVPASLAGQSPSTIANMMKHSTGESVPLPTIADTMPVETPQPPGIVAGTPATAAALESRNKAIAQALSGRPEPGRTSPRKF